MNHISSSTRPNRLTQIWALLIAVAKSRSIHDLSLTLLPNLAKLRLSTLSAIFVYLSIRPISKSSGPSTRPIRILILEKSIFNDDAISCFGHSEQIQLYGLSRGIVKSVAAGILPKEVRYDGRYKSSSPAIILKQNAYRNFWKGVWRRLSLVFRFDAVISGNWAYYAERDFAGALEELGTPFIVLHKECLKPPGLSDLLADLFHKTRGEFFGRRILAYHDTECEHLLAAKTTTKDRISIVGMPRLDRVHEWRQSVVENQLPWCSETPTAVLFAPTPIKILPAVWGIDCGLRWNQLTQLTYDAFIAFAKQNPSVHVIIRPKVSELRDVQEILDAIGQLPPNLSVDHKGDVFGVIQRSWVVCGHNTTAVLEAIAAGKPTIVPHFAEATEPEYAPFVLDVEGGAEHATSPEDLILRLEKHTRLQCPPRMQLSPDENQVLQKWTGNQHGTSTRRVLDAILSEINLQHTPRS